MKLVVTNLTSSSVALGGKAGTIKGARTVVFDMSMAELEALRVRLSALEASGTLSYFTAPTDTLADDSAEGTTVGYVKSNGTFIPDPAAATNANFSAADVVDPIMEVAPSATRNFDPRDATTSMAFTLWKSNALAFGIVIDVTTGGNQGWTTDAGLNTNFNVPNSAGAASGQWLIRIDLPNKRINVLPSV